MRSNFYQTVLPETKTFFRLSIPLILAYVVQAASNFSAVLMLARVGPQALAALALVNGIYVTTIIFSLGLLSAVSVLAAIAYGAKDAKGVAMAAAQGFHVAIFLSFIIMGLLLLAPHILTLTGQDPEVVKLCIAPLHAFTFTAITWSLLAAFEQFLIGIGKMRLVLAVSLFEVPLEILAYYVLVFGKFGFPKMGVAGIGYGFAIVFLLTLIFLLVLVRINKSFRQYAIFSSMKKFDWHIIWEIFRIGTPSGLTYVVEVAFWMVLAFLMGKLGVASLAAHQITTQYSTLTFMIAWGMAQTVGTRVGHAVGEKNKCGVKVATYVAAFWSFLVMSIIVSFYWLCPHLAISVDLNLHDANYQEVIKLAVPFLAVMAIGQVGDTLRFVAGCALRSLKDTKVPLLIITAGFWLIGLPLGYWLAFTCHLGGAALWGSGALVAYLLAAILWYRFQKLVARVDLEALI